MGTEVQIIENPDTIVDNLSKSLEAPKLDPIMLSIANKSLSGKGVSEISQEMEIREDLIASVLAKNEVKSYVTTVMLQQGYLNRAKRLALIETVINNKVLEAVETGLYSKKDLLDWLKLVQLMEDSISPKDKAGVAVQINNNYTKLVQDLLINDD